MSEATDLYEDERREESAGAGAAPPEEEDGGVDALFGRLEGADRWARAFVKEHPVASVAAAAVAGFAIGRIAARYR